MEVYLKDLLSCQIEKSREFKRTLRSRNLFSLNYNSQRSRMDIMNWIINASLNLGFSIHTGMLACSIFDKFMSLHIFEPFYHTRCELICFKEG